MYAYNLHNFIISKYKPHLLLTDHIYIYKPQNNETNNDKYLQMTKMFPRKQNIKFSCKKRCQLYWDVCHTTTT